MCMSPITSSSALQQQQQQQHQWQPQWQVPGLSTNPSGMAGRGPGDRVALHLRLKIGRAAWHEIINSNFHLRRGTAQAFIIFSLSYFSLHRHRHRLLQLLRILTKKNIHIRIRIRVRIRARKARKRKDKNYTALSCFAFAFARGDFDFRFCYFLICYCYCYWVIIFIQHCFTVCVCVQLNYLQKNAANVHALGLGFVGLFFGYFQLFLGRWLVSRTPKKSEREAETETEAEQEQCKSAQFDSLIALWFLIKSVSLCSILDSILPQFN